MLLAAVRPRVPALPEPCWEGAGSQFAGCEIRTARAEYSWVNAPTLNERPFSGARGLVSFRKVMINLYTEELYSRSVLGLAI